MATLNALAPTDEINTAIAYFNAHGYQVIPEYFYDKVLLDTIQLGSENYVHYRLAELKPIQGKAEKLQVRRWSPLNAHTVPLVEGIPPKSDMGSMESYELGVHQYGRYMEFTDKVEWEILDPIILHYTKQYSIVAVETLDLLARDALMAVPNKYFAGMVPNLGGLTISDDCKPNLTDLRIIVLGMKKRLVKPRKAGKYHVICTPDFVFDMVTDPTIEKFMTINNTTKSVYSDNVLPSMFEMEFYETMHIDDSAQFMTVTPTGGHITRALRVYRRKVDGTYEYANIYEKTSTNTDSGYYKKETDVYTGDNYHFRNAALNAVPERWVWDVEKWNTDNSHTANPYTPLKVHKILVLGANCLIRTNIGGRDNAKMYVKKLGSAGVLDPLDQRQSIGFKIDTVGFGVERNEAVAIYNCVPSQANM